MTKQKIKKKNICFRCGEFVDKSDCQEGFMTITRKEFYKSSEKGEEKVKSERVLLCHMCAEKLLFVLKNDKTNLGKLGFGGAK